MPFFARPSRLKRFKIAISLLGLGVAASLFFTGIRARRLLSHSREIGLQSAHFSRDYFVGSGPKLTYLAMGDSTAAGWGAEALDATYPHRIASALAGRGYRVHVVNVAVGGATLQQVQREQSGFLASVRPDLVTLSVGANDATHRTADADFGRELQRLGADFAASPASLILVANVPNMFLAPALPYPVAIACGRRARALNRMLQTMPPNSKTQGVDLFGHGKLDYRRDPGLYGADLFHPSGRGYAIWAQLFIERLKVSAFASDTAKGR